MARSLFRGAPELSRLFAEAPIELISEFLFHSQFSVFLGDALAAMHADAEEQLHRDKMAEILKSLKSDRANLIESEARRVMLMTDQTPEAMLRRTRRRRTFLCEGGAERAEGCGCQEPVGLSSRLPAVRGGRTRDAGARLS